MACQPNSLELVAGWHHGEWQRHQPNLNEQLKNQDLIKRIDALKSHVHDHGIPHTLIASVAGRPVGSVSLVFYRFSRNQAQSTWLTNVFVCRPFRGQGIGAKLVSRACEHAKIHAVEKLNLYTHDQQHFYQKRGWVFVRQGRLQKQAVSIFEKTL